MKITINGTSTDVQADTLAMVLEELGYGAAKVATAVNVSTKVVASARPADVSTFFDVPMNGHRPRNWTRTKLWTRTAPMRMRTYSVKAKAAAGRQNRVIMRCRTAANKDDRINNLFSFRCGICTARRPVPRRAI